MRKYILDTNLYIDAVRDRALAEQLAGFTWANLPFIYLHAVVVQELLSGAVGPRGRKVIDRALVAPFERRARLLTPEFSTWKRSGEIVWEMIEARKLSPGSFSRSFLNDVLLAASLRRSGCTLVTRNTKDFERIREFEVFDFVEPWPTST